MWLQGCGQSYYIVKDEKYEYLIKRNGEGQQLLLRGAGREQVYDTILTDLCAPVYDGNTRPTNRDRSRRARVALR